MTIAPELSKKGLALPAAFDANGARLSGNSFHQVILISFGLNAAQAALLLSEVMPLRRKLFRRTFEAVPRDPSLPAVEDLGSITRLSHNFAHYKDLPEFGEFYFKARINVGARAGKAVRDFKKWFREQKKLFGLKRPESRYRFEKQFTKNLVVYALSRDKRWSIKDIDIQLKHMSLPMLATSRTPITVHKTVRRKINCGIRKLIRDYKRSVLVQ
jgi:hypothetical protein